MKTYISGVPNGFNLYEDKAGMDNYFLSFYVSSRKGRRLMVNRRKNGDTIYNYIQYGINDIEGRGRNSFFSMSLLFENGEYTADFKILLDFFDKLFEKIISDEIILTKDKKYKIAKFSDARDYVENIKAVIPKIVSKVSVEKYDNTFIQSNSDEKIAAFGDNKVSDNTLLQALKNYAWISASNIDNTPNPTPIPATAPEIELSILDLQSKSDNIKDLFLQIYRNKNKYTIDNKYKYKVKANIEESINDIEKYLKRISEQDDNEYQAFNDIYKKFKEHLEIINEIIGEPEHSPIPTPAPVDTPTPKKCRYCNANKYLSDFRSPEAEICKECEAKTKTKKCQKCRKQKGSNEFDAKNPFVCKECSSEEKPISNPKSLSLIQKYKFYIVITFAFSLIVFVALLLTNTFPGDDKKQDVVQKPVFERSELNKKLDELENASKEPNSIRDIEKEAENVYSYIEKEYLNDDDEEQIKERLNNTLKNVFNKLQGNFDFSELDEKNPIIKLIESFGSNYDWKNIANDYKKLQDLSIPKDTTEIIEICNKYTGIKAFEEFYDKTINNQGSVTNENNSSQSINIDVLVTPQAPPTNSSTVKSSESNKRTPVYTLTYVNVYGKTETVILGGRKKGFDAQIGTSFTVKCQDGKIKENGQKEYIGTVKAGRQTVNLTGKDNMVLTITGKKKRQ